MLRAHRRHRLEPADLVVRPALVLVARPDRGSRRCRTGGRCDGEVGRASSTRSSSRWSSRRSPASPRLPAHDGDPLALPAGPAWQVSRGFRYAQTVSAAAMAFGHGLQDAAKTAGVVVLALTVGGSLRGQRRSRCGCCSCSAVVICLGTYAGGWRIMRTLGRRIIHLDPPQGFAAETHGRVDPLGRGHRLRRADLDDPRDHLGDHGCRCDQAALRGPVGRCRQHRRRVGADLPRRGLLAALTYWLSLIVH